MTVEARTLLAMVQGHAASGTAATLTFVAIGADGGFEEEVRSYPDLLARGERLAGALAGAGIRPGDRFALLMRNRAAFVEAMVASEIAGTEFVSIDPRIRGEKLGKMLRFGDCRGVIVCPEGWPNIASVLPECPGIEWVWTVDAVEDAGPQSLETVMAAATPVAGVPAALDRPMQWIYTSSTTGDAKAICMSHARFASTARLADTFRLTSEDQLYNGLSLTHANAQLITLACAVGLGIPAVISTQFTKSRLWELLTAYRCTVFNLLGGMTSAIFAEPPGPFDRAHSVRMVISAGMPAVVWPRFEDRFGLEVLEFYGTAEGGLLVNPPGAGPIGSVGKAPPGMVCQILDADDQPCAPGVRGEICFRHDDGTLPQVQYHANPEATADKTRGGWFRSGDIGWKDAEGWVWFSHRAGRSVRRNGDFVDTASIESLLAEQPDVDDVYVYGVRTAATTPGERLVVAAVTPTTWPGEARPLLEVCTNKLGRLGAPDFIQLVRAIPKTASEKPQDRHLVEMINAGDDTLHNKKGPVSIRVEEGKEDHENETTPTVPVGERPRVAAGRPHPCARADAGSAGRAGG